MPYTSHAGTKPHKQSGIERKAADSHERIAEAACFRAEHRGFKGGGAE